MKRKKQSGIWGWEEWGLGLARNREGEGEEEGEGDGGGEALGRGGEEKRRKGACCCPVRGREAWSRRYYESTVRARGFQLFPRAFSVNA